jgi:phosphoesterase RecJ-like protein
MTEQEIEKLLALARGCERVLLTGPEGPDGDSIGACLALARCLERLGVPRVEVAGVPSYRYQWMAGAAEMVPDERVGGIYDLAIVMDGDAQRLTPPVEAAWARARRRAIVDHHGTTTPEGYDVALIDHTSASTCEMVLRLMDAWDMPLDPTQAELLYVGILFDTGGFRHSNTSVSTLRVAARLLEQGINHSSITTRVLLERRPNAMRLQGRILERARFFGDGAVIVGSLPLSLAEELELVSGDLEGIVDSLIYVRGVEVAVLMVERSPDLTKLSLRSRGKVDVARLARSLHATGGGHAKAAGVVLTEPLVALSERLPELLVDAVGSCAA